MIRLILIMLLICNATVYASKPVGFLWYSIDKEKKSERQPTHRGVSFKSLSYTERDSVLRFYTMEALHKARHSKKVEDMRVFLSLQDYWLKESSRFKSLFEQTLLLHPQYDYSVTHPTSNLGAKITDEVRETKMVEVINRLSKSHGLLFFYRGKSPYDLKQIPILIDFCRRFNIPMMPISVDGTLSAELSHSKIDHGQANRLGVHYFPAVLLVNPKNKKVSPIAYGLTTQDVLMERMKQVASQFRGEEE